MPTDEMDIDPRTVKATVKESVRKNGLKKVEIFFGPSVTEQQHAADLDVNTIVQRAQAGAGMPRPAAGAEPQYWDTTKFPTYQEARNFVIANEQRFMQLPSGLRDLLGNDPNKLEPWLKDPLNRPRAEALGLIKPKKSEAPPPVATPPVAATPPPPKA